MTNEQKAVYEKAIALLARREHTEFELTQKLAKRGFDAQDIHAVVLRLEKHGYLSLDRFLDEFLYERLERCVGPLKITSQLRSRGVRDLEIQQAVNKLDPDWIELAKTALQRKNILFRDECFHLPESIADWKIAHRTLKNQGFPDSTILTVIGPPPY